MVAADVDYVDVVYLTAFATNERSYQFGLKNVLGDYQCAATYNACEFVRSDSARL
jgi:hypothetical protein